MLPPPLQPEQLRVSLMRSVCRPSLCRPSLLGTGGGRSSVDTMVYIPPHSPHSEKVEIRIDASLLTAPRDRLCGLFVVGVAAQAKRRNRWAKNTLTKRNNNQKIKKKLQFGRWKRVSHPISCCHKSPP